MASPSGDVSILADEHGRVPVEERRHTRAPQLDLFLDGEESILVHEVLVALRAHARERSDAALRRLRAERPACEELPALDLLSEAFSAPMPPALSHVALAARIDEVERVIRPVARRLVGADANLVLRPIWEALARTAASLPFDPALPRAHQGWLCQQYGAWADVRAAVERDPSWPVPSLLRYWHGLALHHLGEPEAAITQWLRLCWLDAELFAGHAPDLPSAILREGWESFERSDLAEDLDAAEHPASWFPAWFLLRHRGFAHRFSGDEVRETEPVAAQVVHALVRLLPLEARGLSDDVIRERRALQKRHPAFFAYYLDVIGQRRPGR